MITKRPLTSWIFYNNTKWQFLLLGIILVTVAARVFPLEMQKRIINEAIGLSDFDKLLLYSGLYIGSVILAGVLKLAINALQTYIGQKTLITIRNELYEHILSLPINYFRRTQSGVVISSLVTEVAAAAEFVGSAVAVPTVNLLTLAAFAGYLMYLNPLLAGLSFAVYPIEMLIIPRLQRKVNTANRRRIGLTRKISSLIGEAVSGVHEVHANSAYGLEKDKFSKLTKKLYKANFVQNVAKYSVKFTNNLFQGMGPFILFLVGGWLAINGRFDLGALVAFLSAYEKIYDPWKELMDFYQIQQDAKVRYSNVMQQFDVVPDYALAPEEREPYALKGAVELQDVSLSVGGNIKLLDKINLSLKPGEQLALVGFSGSGKSTLALVIGQLFKYDYGKVLIDGHEVSEMSKLDAAANIGIVAQHPFIFNGTVLENLLYSCDSLCMNGNETVCEKPDLDRIIEVVQQVGLFKDILRFGLRSSIEEDQKEFAEKILGVRKLLNEQHGAELREDVEFFEPDKYLLNRSTAANIIYGEAHEKDFNFERLHGNDIFLSFLREKELLDSLTNLGIRLVRETADILRTLPRTPELFEASPISIHEFDGYLPLVDALPQGSLEALSEKDRGKFLKIALGFRPGVHTMAGMPLPLMEQIVDVRQEFREHMQAQRPEAFAFYDRESYIPSISLLENIVFGSIIPMSAGAEERVDQVVIQLLIMEGLFEEVLEMGMHFEVGSHGDRLSGGQRQKIALARTFLKSPPIIILDEATAALDNASQQRIQNLIDSKWKGKSTIISVAHRLDTVKNYDKIAVMKTGRIIEMGGYSELMEKKGVLYELVTGKKSA